MLYLEMYVFFITEKHLSFKRFIDAITVFLLLAIRDQ